MGTIIKRNRTLDRARKLLAKAADPATEAVERETLEAKAQQLLNGQELALRTPAQPPAVRTGCTYLDGRTPPELAEAAPTHHLAWWRHRSAPWACLRCGAGAMRADDPQACCLPGGWCGTAVHRTCDAVFTERVAWLYRYEVPWLQGAPHLMLPDGREAWGLHPTPETSEHLRQCRTLDYPAARGGRQQWEHRLGRTVTNRWTRLAFEILPEPDGTWGLYDQQMAPLVTSAGHAAGYATAEHAAKAVQG